MKLSRLPLGTLTAAILFTLTAPALRADFATFGATTDDTVLVASDKTGAEKQATAADTGGIKPRDIKKAGSQSNAKRTVPCYLGKPEGLLPIIQNICNSTRGKNRQLEPGNFRLEDTKEGPVALATLTPTAHSQDKQSGPALVTIIQCNNAAN